MLATLALALLATGCSAGGTDADAEAELVTLRVNVFGRFGYSELYREYENQHPNVRVIEATEEDLGRYNQRLNQHIAAGSGAGDVVAIEEGQLAQFLENPEGFVNLLEHGAGELEDRFLGWKYEQALTHDRKRLIALGTDVGGMAMCYRRDLFAKAGLPTDRDKVAKLWPSWDDYIAVGKRFQARIGDDRVHFLDAATNTYNSILMQAGDITYFDRSNRLVVAQNPAVKGAWDTSMRMIQAGLSANLRAFSAEWNAGMKNAAFATIACPAWMTGHIKAQAGPRLTGKWDIALVPGRSGNWGGSFLAVPAQSKNKPEAVELVKFLTGAEGQLGAFEQEGNLPSAPALYDNSAVRNARNPYFNNAPIGRIFVEGARNLKPVYLGPHNQAVANAVENAMRSVEQGQSGPKEAWRIAVESAEQSVG